MNRSNKDRIKLLIETPLSKNNINQIVPHLSKMNRVKYSLFCVQQSKNVLNTTVFNTPDMMYGLCSLEEYISSGGKVYDKAECKSLRDMLRDGTYDMGHLLMIDFLDKNNTKYVSAKQLSSLVDVYVKQQMLNAIDCLFTGYKTYCTISNENAVFGVRAYETIVAERLDFLRCLIIDELPKRLRDNWLLVASI